MKFIDIKNTRIWNNRYVGQFRLLKKNRYLSRFTHNNGYCTICEREVVFYELNALLRDNYRCNTCYSIPRDRALINTLNVFYPGWKQLSLHESSPRGPLSDHLKKSAKYSSSYYFDDVPRGSYKDGFRSEDLASLTFEDETFDLFITSDVFEHVMQPEKAFAEIARVLKPGGAHVFTMPWYPEIEKSRQRACLANDKISYLLEPIFHGNPISKDGSLVTYDWGKDFCTKIFEFSKMYTTVYLERNRSKGLDAQFLEVFVSVKNQRDSNG